MRETSYYIKQYLLMAVFMFLVVGIAIVYSTKAESYTFDEEAMEWALGEDWKRLPMWLVDDTWNERHGDIWLCPGTLEPDIAFDTMTDIYYGNYKKVGDFECPSN